MKLIKFLKTRLYNTIYIMLKNFYKENEVEVGIDESGAGPMMGNLYIAGVILPNECQYEECKDYWDMLNDSKKLSAKKREMLFDFIQQIAIDYSIVKVSPEDIDIDNIWHSRVNGFHSVIDELVIKPTHIIVDGNAFKPYYDDDGNRILHKCIKKGDAEYKSIAAASILAKVSHDREVIKLHEEYPQYNWIKNKGYGTREHLDAIKEYGITPYHRKTFGICKKWEELPRNFI